MSDKFDRQSVEEMNTQEWEVLPEEMDPMQQLLENIYERQQFEIRQAAKASKENALMFMAAMREANVL